MTVAYEDIIVGALMLVRVGRRSWSCPAANFGRRGRAGNEYRQAPPTGAFPIVQPIRVHPCAIRVHPWKIPSAHHPLRGSLRSISPGK